MAGERGKSRPRTRTRDLASYDADTLQITHLLTPAELEVAVAVASGASNSSIGKERSCSTATVSNQLSAIYGKLRVHSRIELALLLLVAPERGASRLQDLSQREGEVLQGIGSGHSDKVIAGGLGLRVSTVASYVRRVKRKLGVVARAELAVLAIREFGADTRMEAEENADGS